MGDVWSHAGGGVWAPRFSRQLNDWKVFDVERFLLRLQGRRVYSDVEDQVVWTKARTKDFLLSLFTRHWNREDYGIFLQELFGILWCLQG